MKLGLSGSLSRATIRSPLTPLFLLTALALGLLAVLTIPREEEPQISVPLVDIRIRADGLRAPDAAELVTKPLEAIVKGVDGVEHIYSQTEDDGVLVTARFKVGANPDNAVLRIHEKIRANCDRIPAGIPEPLVVTRGISDVPILVVTLSPTQEAGARWTDQALYQVADELQSELMKTPDVGLTFIVGGRPQEIRIAPDPGRLQLYNVPLNSLISAVRAAQVRASRRRRPAGGRDTGSDGKNADRSRDDRHTNTRSYGRRRPCRDGVLLQFQWSGAALLPAQQSGAGRSSGAAATQGPSQPLQPCDRARFA